MLFSTAEYQEDCKELARIKSSVERKKALVDGQTTCSQMFGSGLMTLIRLQEENVANHGPIYLRTLATDSRSWTL